ncbi:MAG: TRAP transporter large permease subunit [Tissierellia bacterium]|jgi:TRAP-type C4-dicarboxylate transport system permease large subunit|nr:TRAP transporter large permease subunit [Tissierellia bacterium]
MSIEFIIFLAMIGTFLICAFGFKLPASISMMISSIVGALVGREGIALRHLVEGTFSYVDTILVIACAMIFMKVIEKSGALDAISALIIEKFHKKPALLLILVMLVIMFPGMITGSSTASVLSAGSIMAPVLLMMGIPGVEAAAILAMGGILGMIAPPVNIPAMIIGGGIDIPYVGFEVPLLVLTIPIAIFSVLYFGYKYVKGLDYEAIKGKLNFEVGEKFGFRIYIPIILAVILMVLNKLVPAIPDLGMPLVFIISSIVGLFTGYKINILEEVKSAINDALPVMGILMGVGMFIQVMTLTGVRGFIVTACISLPNSLRYVAMAISIPLFGAVSSFGAASVLGVPFLLSFMAKNQIITAAAISLIAGAGDMVPPTALAGIFAAKVLNLESYVPVMKKCIVPVALMIIWSIILIIFSPQLAPFIVFK